MEISPSPLPLVQAGFRKRVIPSSFVRPCLFRRCFSGHSPIRRP
ncbi:Uncharacterized protein APZ42_006833 [Daphnia magna]|uniref:Uncharacterized protein n=1 Tax=Daphnia magna TaxID=35525 RepID=A0A162D2Y7_9CRUS|nr:Uncharacterized protein APZ42_006833 [Daphnia magna]